MSEKKMIKIIRSLERLSLRQHGLVWGVILAYCILALLALTLVGVADFSTVLKQALGWSSVVLLATFPVVLFTVLLKSYNYGQLRICPDIGSVRKAIADLVCPGSSPRMIKHTLIQCNAPSASADFLWPLMRLLAEDRRPEVHRLIVVSTPLDINFAQHSVSLKYGPRLRTVIVSNPSGPRLAAMVGNLTLADSRFLITWPDRPEPQAINAPLKEPDASEATQGLLIKGRGPAGIAEKYFAAIAGRDSEDLAEIKSRLMASDRTEYLFAVAKSFAKELAEDREVWSRAVFVGLVGSVAKAKLDKHKAGGGTAANSNRKGEEPRDVDIVLILSDLPPEVHKRVYNLAGEIASRFSVPGRLKIWPTLDSTPLKPTEMDQGTQTVLPLQVLLNTKDTVNRWAPFVAADRLAHNIALKGTLQDLCRDSFTLTELLDLPLGIQNCLQALCTRRVLNRRWEMRDDRMVFEDSVAHITTEKQAHDFARYSLLWACVNLCRAKDSSLNNPVVAMDATQAIEVVCSKLGLANEGKERLVEIATGVAQQKQDVMGDAQELLSKIVCLVHDMQVGKA